MRRLKLRIERVSDDVRLVLEDWAGILFAIGVGLLLFATLKAQLARAAEFPKDAYETRGDTTYAHTQRGRRYAV